MAQQPTQQATHIPTTPIPGPTAPIARKAIVRKVVAPSSSSSPSPSVGQRTGAQHGIRNSISGVPQIQQPQQAQNQGPTGSLTRSLTLPIHPRKHLEPSTVVLNQQRPSPQGTVGPVKPNNGSLPNSASQIPTTGTQRQSTAIPNAPAGLLSGNGPIPSAQPLQNPHQQICHHCRNATPINTSVYTCLICSTVHRIAIFCEWCSTTGAVNTTHPHDKSYYATESDPVVPEKTLVPSNLWICRKNASGRTWYTHKTTGFKTHIKPVAATLLQDTSGLPVGWEERKTPEGQVIYFNSATGTSAWKKPDNSLPDGWKQFRTPDLMPFYVNESLGLTTWDWPGQQPRFRMGYSRKMANGGSATVDATSEVLLSATKNAAKLTTQGMRIAGRKMADLGKMRNLARIGMALNQVNRLTNDGGDGGDGGVYQEQSDFGGGTESLFNTGEPTAVEYDYTAEGYAGDPFQSQDQSLQFPTDIGNLISQFASVPEQQLYSPQDLNQEQFMPPGQVDAGFQQQLNSILYGQQNLFGVDPTLGSLDTTSFASNPVLDGTYGANQGLVQVGHDQAIYITSPDELEYRIVPGYEQVQYGVGVSYVPAEAPGQTEVAIDPTSWTNPAITSPAGLLSQAQMFNSQALGVDATNSTGASTASVTQEPQAASPATQISATAAASAELDANAAQNAQWASYSAALI